MSRTMSRRLDSFATGYLLRSKGILEVFECSMSLVQTIVVLLSHNKDYVRSLDVQAAVCVEGFLCATLDRT